MKKQKKHVNEQQFIDTAFSEGIAEFKPYPVALKSGRMSEFFFNLGNADRGEVIGVFEGIYRDMIAKDASKDDKFVVLGIPYKSINMASHAALALAREGYKEARWNTYRKEEKDHGGDVKKMMVARGDNIKLCNGKVAILDDVVTTGTSSYEADEVIKKLAAEDGFKEDVIGVYVILDRQEVSTIDPTISAIAQFEKQTGYKVKSAFKAKELIDAGRKNRSISDKQYRKYLTYFRVYGAPDVLAVYIEENKKFYDKILTQTLFMPVERGVIPAIDFTDLNLYKNLLKVTADLDKISGVKISSLMAKEHGLGKVVEITKKLAPKKIIIYDGQKQGSDIPEIVYKQVEQDARLGCDATIIFPIQGGVEALLAGIHSGYENRINVIVGSHMTHHGFLREDGGCATPEDCERFYKIGASKGIRNFVMPGTYPEFIRDYREKLAEIGVFPICVDSPGLITQQGSVSEAGTAAGRYFNGIVGRYIYEDELIPGEYRRPKDMRRICEKLIARL